MKRIFPFFLIAVIVGAALLLLQEDYKEEEFDPIVIEDVSGMFWDTNLFLQEDEEEGYKFGIQLKANNIVNAANIEAIEIFVTCAYENLLYQDLQIENFNGEITYSEKCTYCKKVDAPDDLHQYVDITVNWIENGKVLTSNMYKEMNWNEYFHD